MAEYVDREKLRDALYESDAITMRGVAILNRFPAADVVPVRRGRWIKDCDRVMGDGWTYTQRHCSECGGQTVECVNYCQFCGARMDGDRE